MQTSQPIGAISSCKLQHVAALLLVGPFHEWTENQNTWLAIEISKITNQDNAKMI
jgi:hypothetical protein